MRDAEQFCLDSGMELAASIEKEYEYAGLMEYISTLELDEEEIDMGRE